MGEIKFRAWNKFHKEFLINPWSIACDNFRNPESIIHIGYGKFMKAKNFIFEQYTGLKDKNGVEIYEGDIIHCDNCIPNRYKPFEVKFEDGVFGVRDKPCSMLTPIYSFGEWCHIRILGNIHQNPELLESK